MVVLRVRTISHFTPAYDYPMWGSRAFYLIEFY